MAECYIYKRNDYVVGLKIKHSQSSIPHRGCSKNDGKGTEHNEAPSLEMQVLLFQCPNVSDPAGTKSALMFEGGLVKVSSHL